MSFAWHGTIWRKLTKDSTLCHARNAQRTQMVTEMFPCEGQRIPFLEEKGVLGTVCLHRFEASLNKKVFSCHLLFSSTEELLTEKREQAFANYAVSVQPRGSHAP